MESDAALIDFMTKPSAGLVDAAARLPNRVAVLGAGGKMGPSLCIRLARAAESAGRALDIVAVSRFSDTSAREELERHGIRIIRADLLDASAYASLPDADLVYYLVGQKFGTASRPSATWSANTVIPTWACARYPRARFVALSTGNVYAMTTPESGGSLEDDALHPVGEYAASCVGRERVFEHFAHEGGARSGRLDSSGDADTGEPNGLSVILVRLNYAIDLRYGVLVDIARKIAAGEPVDITTGYFNCIWQGDANDLILRAAELDAAPVLPLNVTGADILRVRDVAEALGMAMGKPVSFVGDEQSTALLSNTSRMNALLGRPQVSIDHMIRWTADWITRGGTAWGKPTHFETRDGRY
jgi:nucleoside-diphosphate-sugar epimerase